MLDRIVRYVFPKKEELQQEPPKEPTKEPQKMPKLSLEGRPNPCHIGDTAIVYHRPGFFAAFWKNSNTITIKNWGTTTKVPIPKEDFIQTQIIIAHKVNPKLAEWYKMILAHVAKSPKKTRTRLPAPGN